MVGNHLSKAAIAGCWVLLFAGVLIAQDGPWLPTRQAEPTKPARPAAARAAETATQPAETAPRPAEPAIKPVETATMPMLVSNVFVDTDLRQALQDVASQVGATIIPDPTVGGLVTCELKDAPLDKALEILLAGTGFSVKKTPDYYLVYSPDSKSPAFRQVSQARMIRLDYAQAETVLRLLSPAYRDFVQADAKGNRLFITAPEALLGRIEADIRQMDQPPGHVMLEARVVVLEQTELLNLGVRWDWPQIRAGVFTNSDFHGGGSQGPDWPWGIQIGYTPGKEFTNSLLLTLNLLAQNDEATIVANPQIMAQDGKEALIKVTNEEYFQIVTPGSIYVQSQLEKIESGTTLTITPRMSGGNEVTLDILVEVSDVVARGENNLPVVSRRSAKSTVRLQDGGTAAIGGLMDTRSQNIRTRTPGIGEVPLLGRLFRSDSNRMSSKQVAVFITASAIEDRQPAAEAPGAYKQPIPPVDAEEFRKALKETMQRMGDQP
jgi:type II secretory pathway component GspD/PulD (secretin)